MASLQRIRAFSRGGKRGLVASALALVTLVLPSPVFAIDAGVIKVSSGDAGINRSGVRLAARVGDKVQQTDVIVTGPDGAVGITFADDSRLSIGPNSVLAIDRFAFNSTTHAGTSETSLRKGTLAAVSGKLTRQSPDAMKVRTPATILGIRGTEFLVRAGEAE
jgi:hypothetical protein